MCLILVARLHQAHVGGTFIFHRSARLSEAAPISRGMSGCFHVSISISSDILPRGAEMTLILGNTLCRGIASTRDLTS